MSKAAPRPPVVSSACLFIGLTSALLLYFIVGWLTSWNSLGTQETLNDLAEALDVSDADQLGQVLRVVLFVLVVVMVAGLVGAFYAARGDRGSRVLISVVAAVTALVFLVSGSFIGIIPAAFAVMSIVRLWSRDANEWFAVKNGQPNPRAAALEGSALEGSAAPAVRADGWPPPPPQPGESYPVNAQGRPSTVSRIASVTIVSSVAALFMSAIYLVTYSAQSRDEMIQEQMESPVLDIVQITESEMRIALTLSVVLTIIAALLSLAALVVSAALLRGRSWAPGALFGLSIATLVVGALTGIGLPWAAAAVWVMVLLRRSETLQWFAQQKAASTPS